MKRARIVVIGAGLIGRKHIELVSNGAELAAIVDPAASARELAVAANVPHFPDLDTCLSNLPADGAIVASPNHLHLEHGMTCLEAGLPVLIEKPLADTSEAARALVERSDRTGVPILVGHHRRHSGVIEAARNFMSGGSLGTIVAVKAMFWLHKPDVYFETGWRTEPGAGPTYINLIHDIDLLQHLCGPISAVQAFESKAIRGFKVEDTSAITLRFESGALGTATISDTVSAPWSWELTSGENPAYPRTDQSCYMIGGTKASLSLPDLRVWSHEGTPSWWSPMVSRRLEAPERDPVECQFRHFLDVVAGKTAPIVTAADGLRNIKVLEAAKRAAESGKTCKIS